MVLDFLRKGVWCKLIFYFYYYFSDFCVFLPELQREWNGSHVFFYDILRQNGESERTGGGTVKFCIVYSMYLYVDFGVPKTRMEQELITSASEKGNHRR